MSTRRQEIKSKIKIKNDIATDLRFSNPYPIG